jgi:hypothetical protein
MTAWWMEQLLDWLAERVLDIVTWVMGLLGDTAFVVPNVAALPQVQGAWGHNLTIVNTIYVLGIVAAGVVAMTHETVQVRYSIKELLPRVVLGGVAANFSLTWCRMILQTADAFTQAVAGRPLSDTASLQVVRAQIAAALTNPEVALLSLLVAAVATVLLVMLVFQWVVRFALLLVLAVVGPFALAAYCLPRLDAMAGLWWRTLAGVLLAHVLQAVTLYTGLAVFLDPDAQLIALLPMAAGQTGNLLVLLILLMACVRIPALVRRFVLRGGGAGGRVLGVLVLQQITRTITAGRGSSGAARGGVPPGPPPEVAMSTGHDVDAPQRVAVPADVDAEDRIAYGLTARQLAVLAVAGTCGYGLHQLLAPYLPGVVLAGLAVPAAGLVLAVVLGRRDGIGLDMWLAAAARHWRTPRRQAPTTTQDVRGRGRGGRKGQLLVRTAGPPLPVPAPLVLPAEAVSPDGVLALPACAEELRTPAGTHRTARPHRSPQEPSSTPRSPRARPGRQCSARRRRTPRPPPLGGALARTVATY